MVGALFGVGRFTLNQDLSNLREYRTAIYSAVVRACKEVGDEYYEAYFAVRAGTRGAEPLSTEQHTKTLKKHDVGPYFIRTMRNEDGSEVLVEALVPRDRLYSCYLSEPELYARMCDCKERKLIAY